MIEIRFHGRGGQGSVTAVEILAVAAFKDGKYSQAFPKFGPERRGAPVEAYCRIDDKFINLRSQIYEPDVLVVLDESLLNLNITKGLKEDGKIIVNSKKSPDELKKEYNLKYDVHSVDATSNAIEILGANIVNTGILGAFSKVTGLVSLDNLLKATEEKFSGDLKEKNLSLVKKIYEISE